MAKMTKLKIVNYDSWWTILFIVLGVCLIISGIVYEIDTWDEVLRYCGLMVVFFTELLHLVSVNSRFGKYINLSSLLSSTWIVILPSVFFLVGGIFLGFGTFGLITINPPEIIIAPFFVFIIFCIFTIFYRIVLMDGSFIFIVGLFDCKKVALTDIESISRWSFFTYKISFKSNIRSVLFIPRLRDTLFRFQIVSKGVKDLQKLVEKE